MAEEINLGRIDRDCMRYIIEKFSYKAGIRVYQTCKTFKQLLDQEQPRWILHKTRLIYLSDQRYMMKTLTADDGEKYTMGNIFIKPHYSLQFARFPFVNVGKCQTEFFHFVVIPELTEMNGVLTLHVDEMNPKDLEKVLAAAKPKTVDYYDSNYSENDFKTVLNLYVNVHMFRSESYWKDRKRIFKMGLTRKTITLNFNTFEVNVVKIFLEEWIRGQYVGRLQQFSLYVQSLNDEATDKFNNFIDNVLEEEEIAATIIEKNKNETILKRQPTGMKDKLLIRHNEFWVDFTFE